MKKQLHFSTARLIAAPTTCAQTIAGQESQTTLWPWKHAGRL